MIGDLAFRDELVKLSQPLVDELESAYAVIDTAWAVDHADTGAHLQVHERNRTAAMGEWTHVAPAPAMFTAPSGSTWTVPATTVYTLQWTLIGRAMTVIVEASGTLAGAACNTVYIQIPAGYLAASSARGYAEIADNAAVAAGMIQAGGAGAAGYLAVLRTDRANLTNGTVGVYGEVTFEVTTD